MKGTTREDSQRVLSQRELDSVGVVRPIPASKAEVEWVRVTPAEVRKDVTNYRSSLIYFIEGDELWRVRPRGSSRFYEMVPTTVWGTDLTLGTSDEDGTVLLDIKNREAVKLFPFPIRPTSDAYVLPFLSRLRVAVDQGVDSTGNSWRAGIYDLELLYCTMTLAQLPTEGLVRHFLHTPLSQNSVLPGASVVEVRRAGYSRPGLVALTSVGGNAKFLYEGPDPIELSPHGLYAVRVVGYPTERFGRFEFINVSKGSTTELTWLTSPSYRVEWSPGGRYLVLMSGDCIVLDVLSGLVPREIARFPATHSHQWTVSWATDERALLVRAEVSSDASVVALPGGAVSVLRGLPAGRLDLSPRSTFLLSHGIGTSPEIIVRVTGQPLRSPALTGLGEFRAGFSWDEKWLLLRTVGGHN